jgi:hypothetical protein
MAGFQQNDARLVRWTLDRSMLHEISFSAMDGERFEAYWTARPACIPPHSGTRLLQTLGRWGHEPLDEAALDQVARGIADQSHDLFLKYRDLTSTAKQLRLEAAPLDLGESEILGTGLYALDQARDGRAYLEGLLAQIGELLPAPNKFAEEELRARGERVRELLDAPDPAVVIAARAAQWGDIPLVR